MAHMAKVPLHNSPLLKKINEALKKAKTPAEVEKIAQDVRNAGKMGNVEQIMAEVREHRARIDAEHGHKGKAEK